MPVQNLNPVQVKYVNETVRPWLESLVALKFSADRFLAEANNQQDPIVANGNDLGDGVGGTVARTNAPRMTGTQHAQLVTFTQAISDQVDGPALNALIALMVRDVNTVVKGG